MNLQASTGNRVSKLPRETLDAWLEDNALRPSAALACYPMFPIAPLLAIAVSIVGLVLAKMRTAYFRKRASIAAREGRAL